MLGRTTQTVAAYTGAAPTSSKNNLVNSSYSELYRVSSLVNGDNNTAYDPLGRLVGFRRGSLGADSHNGGMLDYLNTFNGLADHQEDFTLDAVGQQTKRDSGCVGFQVLFRHFSGSSF